MLSLALVNSNLIGECQTLTYMKSCGYVGLLGYSSPWNQVNISPIDVWY